MIITHHIQFLTITKYFSLSCNSIISAFTFLFSREPLSNIENSYQKPITYYLQLTNSEIFKGIIGALAQHRCWNLDDNLVEQPTRGDHDFFNEICLLRGGGGLVRQNALFNISTARLTCSSDHNSLREDLNRKKTFSFGHCPNYLTPPPPDPNSGNFQDLKTTWGLKVPKNRYINKLKKQL